MPKIAQIQEVSPAQAIAALRAHLEAAPLPDQEFTRGDIVDVGGKLGIVYEVNSEGPSIFYLDDDGFIKGPSFDWELKKYQGEGL